MHRLIVALLAAVDAAIAVAVGLAAVVAPLTLLWMFGLGGADWSSLWPASAAIWQLGNLVPLAITIPAGYIASTGIDPAAASFTLSLAPLAFAGFTAIFAARSGARASRAEAWLTGVVAGSLVVAALSTLVAFTSANDVAASRPWQAVLLPTAVFALPALVAAVVTEWREAGTGAVARLRDRVEAVRGGWGAAPGLIARGTAVVVAGLVGVGALLTAVALILKAGDIIALYETAHLDVLGATVVTLAQLAYVPTLVVWGLAFVAGPGFTVGAGTSVSPAGTQLGVVPGLPLLGILPESTTPWLLLLALAPVALGALAGWIARSRLAGVGAPTAATAQPQDAPVAAPMPSAPDTARTSALAGLLAASPVPTPDAPPDPLGVRLVITIGIAVLSAGGAAFLAAAASGSLGPGRLAVLGPAPGPVALAVGLEVVLGAGILLISPRPHRRARTPAAPTPAAAGTSTESDAGAEEALTDDDRDSPTEQIPDALREPREPREPFTFPTLPRITHAPRIPGPPESGSDAGGGDGRDAPLD
ncbi:cell division protein PerM [Microbacterium deminutum]|uniref:Integral membrane protein n=1 Tax=Microbacterium deminutum TaxID=344164 RepID=A0ABN2Q8D1_9MICO